MFGFCRYLNEAKAEAERRLAEFDAADAEEAGNIENSSETLLAVDFEDDSDEWAKTTQQSFVIKFY